MPSLPARTGFHGCLPQRGETISEPSWEGSFRLDCHLKTFMDAFWSDQESANLKTCKMRVRDGKNILRERDRNPGLPTLEGVKHRICERTRASMTQSGKMTQKC